MCIFFHYLHYYKKRFQNRHVRPVTEGPKWRCCTPRTPLDKEVALIKSVFVQTVPFIRNTFQGQVLTLIFTIVLNFGKLPYLEVTFLERCYLSILVLYRPIIYRPDDLFHFFCRFCISLCSLAPVKNFMVIHPVVQGAALHPLPYLSVNLCQEIYL